MDLYPWNWLPKRGKTVTAREAGIFLPGDAIIRKGDWGTCVIPSYAAMAWPHGDDDVFVRWYDGSMNWVQAASLQYRN